MKSKRSKKRFSFRPLVKDLKVRVCLYCGGRVQAGYTYTLQELFFDCQLDVQWKCMMCGRAVKKDGKWKRNKEFQKKNDREGEVDK